MNGKLTSQQKRIVVCACLVSFVAMDSSLTNTVFSYIAGSYPDVPAETLQLFMRVGPIVGTAGALLIGPVSMRISKKILVVFALAMMSAVAVIYITMGGKCPYEVLIICSALDGLETSILSSIPSALVTVSISNRGVKNRYNGYIQASKFGGALMFSILGGLLAVYGWQRAYGLYLIAVPILILTMLFLPHDEPYRHHEKHLGDEDERLTGVSIMAGALIYLHYVMFFVCTFTMKANLSIYIISENNLGTSLHAGVINSFNTLAGIVAGLLFGRTARKFRNWTAPLLSLMVFAGFLIYSVKHVSIAGCIVGIFLIGFAKGGMTPFAIYKLSVKIPKKYIATAISLLIAFMNFGQAISGWIIQAISTSLLGEYSVHNQMVSTCIMAGLLTVTAVIVYLILDSHDSDRQHGKHDHHDTYDHNGAEGSIRKLHQDHDMKGVNNQ